MSYHQVPLFERVNKLTFNILPVKNRLQISKQAKFSLKVKNDPEGQFLCQPYKYDLSNKFIGLLN